MLGSSGEGYDSYCLNRCKFERRGRERANLEARFHSRHVPLWVLFLSLLVTSEVRWHVSGFSFCLHTLL